MSQEQQDTPDYVRVTLTIHEFFEDGECCIVSDKHGHGTELSTDAFLHDAEDIDVGDTIACDILREAWEDTGLTPDDAGPHDVRACGRENIEMLVDLTDEQLLELGSEMADALRERDKLETELLAVKKDYPSPRLRKRQRNTVPANGLKPSPATALKIGRRWRSHGAIP